jgi:hypothetical protein
MFSSCSLAPNLPQASLQPGTPVVQIGTASVPLPPDAAPPSRRRRHRIAACREEPCRCDSGTSCPSLFGRTLNGQHHTSHRSNHRGYRPRWRLVRPGTLVLSKSPPFANSCGQPRWWITNLAAKRSFRCWSQRRPASGPGMRRGECSRG